MADIHTYAQESKQVYFVIGTQGPIFTAIPVFMIKICVKRIHEMYEIKKVSLNLINLWMYKFIILTLII